MAMVASGVIARTASPMSRASRHSNWITSPGRTVAQALSSAIMTLMGAPIVVGPVIDLGRCLRDRDCLATSNSADLPDLAGGTGANPWRSG
jgi:hypothetical protein